MKEHVQFYSFHILMMLEFTPIGIVFLKLFILKPIFNRLQKRLSGTYNNNTQVFVYKGCSPYFNCSSRNTFHLPDPILSGVSSNFSKYRWEMTNLPGTDKYKNRQTRTDDIQTKILKIGHWFKYCMLDHNYIWDLIQVLIVSIQVHNSSKKNYVKML